MSTGNRKGTLCTILKLEMLWNLTCWSSKDVTSRLPHNASLSVITVLLWGVIMVKSLPPVSRSQILISWLPINTAQSNAAEKVQCECIYNLIVGHGALLWKEMKARIGPSGKLLCFRNIKKLYNTSMETFRAWQLGQSSYAKELHELGLKDSQTSMENLSLNNELSVYFCLTNNCLRLRQWYVSTLSQVKADSITLQTIC